MKAKSILQILAVVATCIAVAWLMRRPTPTGDNVEATITTQHADTITLRDTIYITRPTLVGDSKSLGFITATLPTYRPFKFGATGDEPRKTDIADEPLIAEESDEETEPPNLVEVQIPIEQRRYRADEYEAWVSGYNPQLDSLHIYRTNTQITTETLTEVTKWRTARWGLSIGVGATLNHRGEVSPGVFVGATYTFLAF